MPITLKTDPLAKPFTLGLGHGIFLLAFAFRLWALIRLTHSALLLPSRGDMYFYNDWARQILHGQVSQPLAFYGLPGYAYLLAGFWKLFGENPFIPGLVQAALDAGTSVLIYLIAVAIFESASPSQHALPATTGRVVGTGAAIGWALFVPAQAYSIVLMPTAWFVFGFWFILWRIVRSKTGPTSTE